MVGLKDEKLASLSCLFSQNNRLKAYMRSYIQNCVAFFDQPLKSLEVNCLPGASFDDRARNGHV